MLDLDNNLKEASRIIKEADALFITAGAGEAVATVRYNSENIARMHNAILIRINPRDYNVPPGHLSIPLSAAEGIDSIYQCIK